MKKTMLLALAMCMTAGAAHAGDCPAVLSGAFTGCKTAGGIMRLGATQEYLNDKAGERAAAVAGAAGAASGLAVVAWPGGGELWSVGKGAPERLNGWNDLVLDALETSSRRGNWFAYFGGQVMSGGDYPYSGFNARLGTMLLKNRYDASLGYSTSKPSEDGASATRSLDLTGRALFNFTRHSGLNAGARLGYARSGDADGMWTPAVLGGLNIYLPQGSLDLTVTFGEAGSRSVELGYTVYFNRGGQ